MKIGRNDPCPCGSGKKYKKCCLNQYGGDEDFPLIIGAVLNGGYDKELADVLCKLLWRMKSGNGWVGACHATSAVLYVALKELGLDPRLCVGEVDAGFLFDHSWVELDDKIIDLAVSLPLPQARSPLSPPIILDMNIRSGERFNLVYGTDRGRGLDREAQSVIGAPFTVYMDNYPDEEYGLWGVVNSVLSEPRDVEALRQKYVGAQWNYIQTPHL